jgi:hypothetical protein
MQGPDGFEPGLQADGFFGGGGEQVETGSDFLSVGMRVPVFQDRQWIGSSLLCLI